jgi:pimeloyl-ACP methyl ester carboxylesterase
MPKLVQVLAGLATGSCITAYRRDLQSIRMRVRDGGQIAETRRGPIEYGFEGTGAPALVIHGAGGGYDQGLLLARTFAPSHLKAIAPSRFGYLGTPLPKDASTTAQAYAHAALLESLAIESAVVVGASAGAPSAVELALHYPELVRALILPVPRGYEPNAAELPLTRSTLLLLRLILSSDFVYWTTLRLGASALVRSIGVPPDLFAGASAADREWVTAMMENILPIGLRLAGLKNDAATTLKPLPFAEIRAPTLIISARDDLFKTLPAAEFMAARIPRARLLVIDSGGHLFVGRRREITDAIADFLADVSKGRRNRSIRTLAPPRSATEHCPRASRFRLHAAVAGRDPCTTGLDMPR